MELETGTKQKKEYKEYFAMKKCVPRTSDRIITVLAAIVCACNAETAEMEPDNVI